MLTKALMIYVVARLTKSNHPEALDRALLMAQGGEFAFVLFSAATTAQIWQYHQVEFNRDCRIVYGVDANHWGVV